MITLKTILVPTDFSDCSTAAVRYGFELARAFDATLHLLHVVADPYTQPWAAEAFPAALGDMLDDWQREATRRLEQAVPPDDRARATVSCTVAQPVTEILRYAAAKDIDLIVMGTHGRGAMAQMFLGSVAERVVRRAPCPVLTVRHPEHEFVSDAPAATASAAAR